MRHKKHEWLIFPQTLLAELKTLP